MFVVDKLCVYLYVAVYKTFPLSNFETSLVIVMIYFICVYYTFLKQSTYTVFIYLCRDLHLLS